MYYLSQGRRGTRTTDGARSEILAANKAMADKACVFLLLHLGHTMKNPRIMMHPNGKRPLLYRSVRHDRSCSPEVKEAIHECRSAGVQPIMITGDHIDTARAIAQELDILEDGKIAVTGSELNEMSDEEFESLFRDITVYARVQPDHKTRIVKAWRSAGYVTAMTGDGVNYLSIKSADIGIEWESPELM